MRKTYLTAAVAAVLAASMLSSSCIGSFALTNKLLDWNRGVGSKFVNELVFFAFWIIPVYEVTALADVLVLNSIEFWSGDNPIAEGKSIIEGEDGKYLVDCDGKGYTITSMNDMSSVRLDFDIPTQTWSIETPDGDIPFMTFVDDTHVKMVTPEGDMQLVELSQEGLLAYQHVASPFYALAK